MSVWDLPYLGFSVVEADDLGTAFGLDEKRIAELAPLFDTVQKKMVADFYKEIKENVKVDEELAKSLEAGETGGAIEFFPHSGKLHFPQMKYLKLVLSSQAIKNNRESMFVCCVIGKMLERFATQDSHQIIKQYVTESCDVVLKAHGKEAHVGII